MRSMVLLLPVTMLAVACGSGDDDEAVVPLATVDESLVPATLAAGDLALREDEAAVEAFGRLPDNALVADGKLYAIRQGERLVATLQLSTLLPEVDLTDADRREEILDKLLPGVKSELSVADVPVFEFATDDKVVYVWFGRQLFEVLQIKGISVEPEEVLAELIAFQVATKAWDPLPEEIDET